MSQQEKKRENIQDNFNEDPKKEKLSIEFIRQRRKELKDDCKRQLISIFIILFVLIAAIIQPLIWPSSKKEETHIDYSKWLVYSENQPISSLFEANGYNISDDSLSSNILWISNQDLLVTLQEDKKSQQVFNTYGNSLLSKYSLYNTLQRFDLKDAYRFIQPRKFIARTFIIPFLNETDCEDYLELANYRKYNSSYTFIAGVENNSTGKVVLQQVVKGSANFLSIYNNYKSKFAPYSSSFIFFFQKIVQTPVKLDSRPLEIFFPISVVGKTILYNETNIFAKSYSNQQELEDILNINAFSSNQNDENNRIYWKAIPYRYIVNILYESEQTLSIMKYIISYCMEAMFDKDFPDHEGRNRYSLYVFTFQIDQTDSRVYLTNIEQNSRIKSSTKSSFNKLILGGYKHLIDNLAPALKQKIQFNRNCTLRVYKNAIQSELYLHDNEKKTPEMFKTVAPLDYNFRVKKVVVYSLQNFLNFYQYFHHKQDFMSLLKSKQQYNQYEKTADIYFAKHISKFRPYKNAEWGSESGWQSRTKFRFQMDLNQLTKSKKHKNFEVDRYIPKTYFFNMTSSGYINQFEKEFLKNYKNLKGLWIYKPSSSYGGIGIRLSYNLTEILTAIDQQKRDLDEPHVDQNEDGFSLVQKYIEKPYLINKKKFDFRMYPIMISASPLVVVYLNGYVRSSLFEYTLSSLDEGIHLTNLHVQKNHPQFNQLQDQAHITIQDFENRFFLKDFSQEKLEVMYNHIKAVCSFSLQAIYQSKKDNVGRFQAYGVDIMIDDQANVQLIEMNSNPYFINGTTLHINLLPKLIKNFLDLSTEILRQNEVYGKVISTDFIVEMCPHCDILIDETKNFYYLNYFNQTTGQFNYDNPVYKNKKREKFTY
ncbi:hypothetical protein ABPG72_001599 [Tetrahymena utriculariae]